MKFSFILKEGAENLVTFVGEGGTVHFYESQSNSRSSPLVVKKYTSLKPIQAWILKVVQIGGGGGIRPLLTPLPSIRTKPNSV